VRPAVSAAKATAYILRDRGRSFESGLAGLRLSALWLLGFFNRHHAELAISRLLTRGRHAAY